MATFMMPLPTGKGGKPEQRLDELEQYVYLLVEQLRLVLSALDERNLSDQYHKEQQELAARVKALENK